jgi:hypothetical protein
LDFSLIKNKTNYGASHAYNQGIKKYYKYFDFVWKLDNDVVVDKNSLKNLLNKFKIIQNLGITGSVIFPLYSTNDYVMNFKGKGEIGCKINNITTIVSKKLITKKDCSTFSQYLYEDLDYLIGCSNLIKKEVFNEIGLFDESFFLYYDDSYFCITAKRKGFKVVTATDSIVFHKGSASTGGVFKPLGIYYATLSELIFFKKTMFSLKFVFYFPLIFVKRIMLTLVRLLGIKDFSNLISALFMVIKANYSFLSQGNK